MKKHLTLVLPDIMQAQGQSTRVCLCGPRGIIDAARVVGMILMIYIVLGCVFESLSMLLLTVPIFFPITIELGYVPIWFGIIVVVVTDISLITPPVELNVFVLKGVVKNVSTATIFRGVTPFWIVDILRLAALLALPSLALYLPGKM